MKTLTRIVPLAGCLLAALAIAHGAGAHYKATVKAVSDKQLTLETEDKKEIVVGLDEKTKFEKGSAPAALKDVKVGARVVVHTAKAENGAPPKALVVKIGAEQGAQLAPPDTRGGATFELAVTEDGFEPGKLAVKKGTPVKLVVTRKTDATCAKELVIDDPPAKAQLPLNQPVVVAFTPKKTGELKFGCGMGKMVSGVILVE